MAVFNLEHYPNVCRLCLKPDLRKFHSLDDNFGSISLPIKTFLEDVTYQLPEDKQQYIPKLVCDPCLTQLTDFAVYRNRLVVTLRFMEALVDLQHSNPKSITSLFRDSKDELDKVFTELSLCNKSDPQVEDIIQEFQSRNFVKCTPEVKVEKAEPSDPEEDSTMYDVPYDDICDVVCQMKSESDDSSSDDDKPLVKRKPPKSKSPRISSKSTPTTGKKKPGRPRIHPEGKMLEAPWSCDKCKFKTKYRMAVDRHKAVHEKRENRTYPCTICEMVFKTKDEWRNHSMNHPENQIVCEVCGAALKNPNSYKSHMERHEEKRKYQCEYCEYASHTLLALKAHMNVHKTDNGKKRCEICSAVFKTGSLLKRHMEGHSNERKYHCEACPARFNTNNALRNHRNRVHLAIRHPCDYCDKTFDQKIILRDHIERVHHIQCQFICDICVITFDSQEKLDVHRQRHENPKPLECSVCLTIHATQEAFNAHLCITYRDDYLCCNKDLRNHAQYNRHMWVKHGLKTNVRVKPIPGMLLGNMRGTRKRLEQCRKCDIAFPTRALKLEHMNVCRLMDHPDGV
ncbi:AAEL002751-PA [Aedes aegypti]|uniref:AAEL002751-PA n=1 Tax=Aedes aegypti TaxID=7159 RepID=Q17H97_AEDAE|nr:AAEL002751-PA [Aedes aegypti]